MKDNPTLYEVAEEHLASYFRLANAHEGRSEDDDDMAFIYRNRADAIMDMLEDWKKRGGKPEA